MVADPGNPAAVAASNANGGARAEGRCLCGAVRFVAPPPPHKVGMCHCGMCRRWTGGAPLTGDLAAGVVTVTAGDSLRWYAASSWGERGFCGDCGASLFWRQKGADAGWLVCIGALPDAEETRLIQHIYIDDKPAYYDMADAVPRLTGGEFTAAVVAKMPLGKRLFVKTFIALQALKNRISPPPPRAPGGDQRGRCLCGGVNFRLPQTVTNAALCHCGQCRRWGGGVGVICTETDGAVVESGDTLHWCKTSANSERGFCEHCGTSLFWRATTDGKITDICIGALEDGANITLDRHIYVDDKPAFYEMAGSARRLTGVEAEG